MVVEWPGRDQSVNRVRQTGEPRREPFPGDQLATARVVIQAFSELGLEAVLGACRGYIDFDAESLYPELPEALP